MARIKVYDKDYPYVPTMGALLAFKEETGIEASAVADDDTQNNVKFAYLVTKYACRKCHEPEMTLSFEEFCLGLDLDEYFRVTAAYVAEKIAAAKADGKSNLDADAEGGKTPKKETSRRR